MENGFPVAVPVPVPIFSGSGSRIGKILPVLEPVFFSVPVPVPVPFPVHVPVPVPVLIFSGSGPGLILRFFVNSGLHNFRIPYCTIRLELLI